MIGFKDLAYLIHFGFVCVISLLIYSIEKTILWVWLFLFMGLIPYTIILLVIVLSKEEIK